MSLGGGASTAVDTAVKNAIADGVTFAVAAGNSNADACRILARPRGRGHHRRRHDAADAKASYSNYGKCLDLWAPGSGITSAWNTDNTAVNTISGTSMATPHVAGVAALLLQGGNQSPSQVAGALVGAVSDVVTGIPGKRSGSIPKGLLFTNY